MTLAPEHTSELLAPHLPAEENELSRRYLRLLEGWIPIAVGYFQEWPVRPHCGHFFGGVHWYGNETIDPVQALALAASSPEFDERAATVSREDLVRLAIMGLRYLCFTHDTGPEDCVRPATGLGRPENCGRKWGERGRGFFPESQCGHGIAAIGQTALMLRDHLDEETWMMVARIHADYAGRFAAMPPKSGLYVDTQMEENAWTSTGLASCYLFLERHPDAPQWEISARKWMFSTCAAPQDARDSGAIGDATVRQLAGKIFTTLPDYWAENHGMVHPNYTGSGVRSLMSVGCQLRMWGRDLPEELFWNRRRVYEGLKAVTDGAGYPQAVQGMDWPYLPTNGFEAPHAIASIFFDDPEAAALQRRGLRNVERRMQGNGGRMYDKELSMKAHGQQDPLIIRESGIRGVSHNYLLHRLFGPGAEPVSEEVLERRLAGVRSYAHAGFVHHRHGRGQTSLSWRNSIMALPLTREGIYTIAPCSDAWLGTPVVKGRPDSHRQVAVNLSEHDDAFAAAVVLDRCQESLQQQVLFASLPDGRILSSERFVARQDLELASLHQGFLRITNEHFPLLAPNCRGARTLYRPDGSTDYRGWLGANPSEDVVDDLGSPAWLNVDGRLGIRFSGSGRAVYHNRHFFKPYRAIADDLTLSAQDEARALRSGEEAGRLDALLIPEQEADATAGEAFARLDGPDDTACLACAGFLAAANFADTGRVCTFRAPRDAGVPAYRGAMVGATADGLSVAIRLRRRSASLLACACTVITDADVRVDTQSDGTCWVTHLGEQTAAVTVDHGSGRSRQVDIPSGETVRVQGPASGEQ